MKKQYIKPEIEIFEYKAEQGYATSVFVHDHDFLYFDEAFTETRTESENWTADDDEGFWLNSW